MSEFGEAPDGKGFGQVQPEPDKYADQTLQGTIVKAADMALVGFLIGFFLPIIALIVACAAGWNQ